MRPECSPRRRAPLWMGVTLELGDWVQGSQGVAVLAGVPSQRGVETRERWLPGPCFWLVLSPRPPARETVAGEGPGARVWLSPRADGRWGAGRLPAGAPGAGGGACLWEERGGRRAWGVSPEDAVAGGCCDCSLGSFGGRRGRPCPGSSRRAGLSARLQEAEVAPASPAWPGARTSAHSQLAPASGAARQPTPIPLRALPFHLVAQPILAPIPPRPRPPTFPAQSSVQTFRGTRAVCVCMRISFLFNFIILFNFVSAFQKKDSSLKAFLL